MQVNVKTGLLDLIAVLFTDIGSLDYSSSCFLACIAFAVMVVARLV